MPNIFEILEIQPTSDFSVVKKAYLRLALKCHPDKAAPDDKAHAEENFKLISNAFAEVDDSTKLDVYYQTLNASSGVYADNQTSQSDIGPENGLGMARSGFVNIFIAIPIIEPARRSENTGSMFELPSASANTTDQTFEQTFPFDGLAEFLTRRSAAGLQQIGVTDEEAVSIVNQHSRKFPGFRDAIVEVVVPLASLSDGRVSERELAPGILSARNGTFFILARHTTFTREQIVSARPMDNEEFRNTISFAFLRCSWLAEVWPGRGLVRNTNSVPQITEDVAPAQHQQQLMQEALPEAKQSTSTTAPSSARALNREEMNNLRGTASEQTQQCDTTDLPTHTSTKTSRGPGGQ